MTDEQRPATVTIRMTATDENGKPLAGISRSISIIDLSAATYPLLVETAASAATELDGIISAYYGMPPRT